MVKPITTKKELLYFKQYLYSIKSWGCRTIKDCYSTGGSKIKQSIFAGIAKECRSNLGDHLTVTTANCFLFTTGYIIDAGNGEVYFVRHSKGSRVEYKLNKEQQEMIPWLEK